MFLTHVAGEAGGSNVREMVTSPSSRRIEDHQKHITCLGCVPFERMSSKSAEEMK